MQVTEINADPSAIVSVTQGKLQGNYNGVSRDGRPFYTFLGIQFAIVPGRFELAVPPEAWDGVKPAVTYGPTCEIGGDDCLYLNVYTPKLGAEHKTLLPTVIYIHGGSFQGGSNRNYGPDYFMDEDIVLVVIQYRLGVLGFLSTGDDSAPGNNGLKDQVMAMKWVQQNIHAFGGDKDRVTIMGQSAGSASITYHLISPLSRGLFQNAIAQSGTFLDPWAFTRNPLQYAKQLAEFLKLPASSTTVELVNSLKSVPHKDILGATRKAVAKWHVEPIAAFGPVIEPASGNPNETFLSQSPYELLVEGNLSKVPLLTGITKEEGIYLWAAYILYFDNPITIQCAKDLQNNWTAVAPAAFYFDEVVSPQDMDNVSLKIRDFYFGNEQINKSTFIELAHLYSDRLFVNSAVKFMNLYSKHSQVYPYLYTFNKYVGIEYGQANLPVDHPMAMEPTHASELDMLFSPLFNKTRHAADHDALSKSMIKLWTSFIYTGMPTETFGSAKNFPPVDPEMGLQKWYQLDSDTQLLDNPFAERLEFWKSLPLRDNDFSSRILPTD